MTSKEGNFREELPSISEVTSPADDYTVCFLAFSKPPGDLGTSDLLHSSYRELKKLRNKRQQHLGSHAGRAERQIQPDDKPPLMSDCVMSPNRTIQGKGQHRASATKVTTESTSPGTSGKLPGTYPFSHLEQNPSTFPARVTGWEKGEENKGRNKVLATLGRGSQDCYHGKLRGPCSGLPKKGGTQFKNQWAMGTQSSAEKRAWPLCLDPCPLCTALEAAMHPLKCVQALNTGSCRAQIMASLPTDHTITSLAAHTLRAGPERRDGHSALGT